LKKIAVYPIIYSVIVSLLSGASIDTLAQKRELTTQRLYWTRYYNQLTINSKWVWHNEIDNRRFFQNNHQHHLIMHSHLHYKMPNNIEIAMGFTYSRQSPQFPDVPSNLVVPELRPFQEITLSSPFSKRFVLSQRVRIDERFIHKNNGKVLEDGYDFNFRFRYRLQAIYLLSKINSKYPTTLKIADEVMFNAGKTIVFNHFDQNRIYVALEQVLNKNLSFEAGYMHWYQQRNTGYQFFKRDILRLTLYHKWQI